MPRVMSRRQWDGRIRRRFPLRLRALLGLETINRFDSFATVTITPADESTT